MSGIGCLIGAQASNAAILQLFAKEMLKGLLLDIKDYVQIHEKRFNVLMNNGARCATFSGSVLFLAGYFNEKASQTTMLTGNTSASAESV